MFSIIFTPFKLMGLASLMTLLPQNILRLLGIIMAPVLAIVSIWLWDPALIIQMKLLDLNVTFMQVTEINRFMVTIFALAALAGGLFAYKLSDKKELFACYLYALIAMACLLSGDLIALIITWEMLAVASVFVLWFSKEKGANAATMRYALWHFFGGAVLLCGIAMHLYHTDFDTSFGSVSLNHISGWLILVGIWLNTGLFPFTSWVVDAYPKASPAGAVFLSSFTTKTAIIIMMRLFAGESFLQYPALITIVVACIYALREDDMRRLLAWAILIQIGFMVATISSQAPENIVAAQASVHILYKSTLFMAAGLIMHHTKESRFSHLPSLKGKMGLIFPLAFIAAATSAAMPLTGGFVAKTWLMHEVSYGSLSMSWVVMTIMSAAAILPTSLWFMRFAFCSNQEIMAENIEIPFSQKLAMILPASLCLLFALPATWSALGVSSDYNIYIFKEIIHALQLIFVMLGLGLILTVLMPPKAAYTVGLDWIWREGYGHIHQWSKENMPKIEARLQALISQIYGRIYRGFLWISSPESPFNAPQPVSKQALYIAVFFGIFGLIWLFFTH